MTWYGSKTLLLTGCLELDLQHTESLEIVAVTTSTSGGALDDPSRSRSLIARRAGRWPTLTAAGGDRFYISLQDVVGFDVGEDGRVTLPRETVTLLRIDNLPTHGAVGAVLAKPPVSNDLGEVVKVFLGSEGRRTRIDLGLLHAAAMSGMNPAQEVAHADDAHNACPRIRIIRVAEPNTIADTKARRLQLYALGLSRFAPAFETTPGFRSGGLPTLRRRQPLHADEVAQWSCVAETWSQATERPAACSPRRPEPAFRLRRWATRDGAAQTPSDAATNFGVKRRAITRLYFGRGWFSSGEGERVGIVLWPPNYFEQPEKASTSKDNQISYRGRMISIADLQDEDIVPGGAFVTRWGGDPIRKDNVIQTEVLIPKTAFLDAYPEKDDCPCGPDLPHRPRIVACARMPVSSGDRPDVARGEPAEASRSKRAEEVKSNPPQFLDVSLLTYEPCFDLDREEWYIDVNLKPIRASEPFVRFGLVRYQEQAITPELRVSEPVMVMTQVLPDREASICITGELAKNVRVDLTGFGSTGIKPIAFPEGLTPERIKAFETLQTPQVKVFVAHELADATGALLCTPLLEADWADGTRLAVDAPGNQLRWSKTVTLSAERIRDLGEGMFVAYVEEVDRRMPATYKSEPISPLQMFDEETYVEFGPRFSVRIPFFQAPTITLPSRKGHK